MKINWFKIDINSLYSFLLSLHPEDFCDLIMYLKQGKWCEDCGESYEFCSCNDCNKCKFKICLCKHNLKYGYSRGDYEYEDYANVEIALFNFIIKNLSKKNIKIFISNKKDDLSYMLRKELNENQLV